MTYIVFTEGLDSDQRAEFDRMLVGEAVSAVETISAQPRNENVAGLMAAFQMGQRS